MMDDISTTRDAFGDGRFGGERVVRVLELYCGIGGIACALKRLSRATTVCDAIDVNPHAIETYGMNNDGTRPRGVNLESAKAKALEGANADAWCASPPCQPFTRAGLKRDVGDQRCASLLRLIDVMRTMRNRPKYVFVENVVGFETSRAREKLLEALREMDFYAQEFILTPTMFGVPYSRPRYFLCARSTRAFEDGVDGLRRSPPARALSRAREWIPNYDESADAELVVAPLARFLDADDECLWREHAVAQADVDRAIGSLDIVNSSDHTCNCFTKSYSQYVKGTGSVISNVRVDKKTWNGVMGQGEDDVRLRYFTVDEVARLHSFPSDFKWPSTLTKRQQYTLLGNSMSVACVAPLLDYLFADD